MNRSIASIGRNGNEVSFYHLGRISLRFVEKNDLLEISRLRNDPSTWGELTDPLPVTERDQDIWLSSISLRIGRFWAVACDPKHSFIGLVRMDEWDPQNRSVRVGLDVLLKLRGQGYGTEIYKALLTYGFIELNAHRIWLQVLATNGRAIRLYEKLGFKLEGVFREAVYRHGSYVDYIVMSILRQEYDR